MIGAVPVSLSNALAGENIPVRRSKGEAQIGRYQVMLIVMWGDTTLESIEAMSSSSIGSTKTTTSQVSGKTHAWCQWHIGSSNPKARFTGCMLCKEATWESRPRRDSLPTIIFTSLR